MSYALKRKEPVQDALRRISREQIDKALGEIDDQSVDPHETVHQVRKRMKKVRALVRLFRKAFDGYGDANRAARDAARRVSDLRDAKVHVDTFDGLVAPHREIVDGEALAPLRAALVEHRERLVREHLVEEERLDLVRADLLALRDAAEKWSLDEKGFDALRGGLEKTYGRARDAMEAAYEDPTPAAFHEWRKRVKYHRHHVRLSRKLWKGPFEALRDELKALTERLGDAHDLHEMSEALRGLDADASDGARRVLRALADRRRAELHEAARPLGQKLLAAKKGELGDRMEAIWRAG